MTATAGVVALAGGIEGYLLKRASRAERLILLISGPVLLFPAGIVTSALAAAGFLLVGVRHYRAADIDVTPVPSGD